MCKNPKKKSKLFLNLFIADVEETFPLKLTRASTYNKSSSKWMILKLDCTVKRNL